MRRAFCIALAAVSLASCGTTVPQVEEIVDDNRGQSLELRIKEKVFCELEAAVSYLNDKKNGKYIVAGTKIIPPVPESWGVTMTLTLTILENSALNPGVALNTPLVPGTTFGAASPQMFSLGLGGTLSSDATRVDKFTFFYLVKDLEQDTGECKGLAIEPGSSLLLESNLGIKPWLDNAADIRAGVGVSHKSKDEVLSYDVKFDVVSSGSVTPTWKLVRVSTGNGSNPFFSTKRERTHELLLTFGPPAQDKKSPGALATTDALVIQLNSALITGARAALSP